MSSGFLKCRIMPIEHFDVDLFQNGSSSASAQKWLKRDACGYAKIVCSLFAHAGLLVCLLAAIWILIQHHSLDETFLLIPASCAVAFYVTILLEANTCETHGALRRLDLSQTAENYIETLRKASPVVQWTAKAYHYDHEDGPTSDDKRRRCPIGLHRLTMRGRHRMTVSFRQNRVFQFGSWRDATVNMSGIYLTPIIRVRGASRRPMCHLVPYPEWVVGAPLTTS